jgi:hypothetical protein
MQCYEPKNATIQSASFTPVFNSNTLSTAQKPVKLEFLPAFLTYDFKHSSEFYCVKKYVKASWWMKSAWAYIIYSFLQ